MKISTEKIIKALLFKITNRKDRFELSVNFAMLNHWKISYEKKLQILKEVKKTKYQTLYRYFESFNDWWLELDVSNDCIKSILN